MNQILQGCLKVSFCVPVYGYIGSVMLSVMCVCVGSFMVWMYHNYKCVCVCVCVCVFLYWLPPVTSIRPPGQSRGLRSPALSPGRGGSPTRMMRDASGKWSWTASINASRRWTATRLTKKEGGGGGGGLLQDSACLPPKKLNGNRSEWFQ